MSNPTNCSNCGKKSKGLSLGFTICGRPSCKSLRECSGSNCILCNGSTTNGRNYCKPCVDSLRCSQCLYCCTIFPTHLLGEIFMCNRCDRSPSKLDQRIEISQAKKHSRYGEMYSRT